MKQRRSRDRRDRLLEQWAAWRMTYEVYTGTGNSPITAFADSPGVRLYGSRLLWRGFIRSELSLFNRQVTATFKPVQVGVLVVLYGIRGLDCDKAGRLGCSCRTLSRLKQQARQVAQSFYDTPNTEWSY